MKVFSVVLIVALVIPATVFGQSVDAKKIAEYSKTLPTVTMPPFDEDRRATLAISAISCADHPQESPANRNNYLWQYAKQPQLLDNYDKDRAFYGCPDWTSAVVATW